MPFHESKFVRQIVDWLHSAEDFLYRELHFDWAVSYLRSQAEVMREEFALPFVNMMNERIEHYDKFMLDFMLKIDRNYVDVCQHGQPSSFWTDPVHFAICS